ncbi:internalin, partial [Erysipelothrix rhusiopathiae]|uniref:leucine-rich repeat domain-containing protein n=1 Tax=Erysipelothrix sp. strain 2 (EsS2-7-Brazil) TaxID=2500579 RepID=UPI001378C4A4
MRKRNRIFIFTLSLCLLISPVFAFADEGKSLDEWFTRPSIAQFVADKLSVSRTSSVTLAQLDTLTTFNPAIGELEDMESFLEISNLRNLESIYLRKQNLKNFEGVENFKNLESLMVVESPIESISGIELLTQLTLISLGYNYSSSFIQNPNALKPIVDVKTLKYIDLRMMDLSNDHFKKLNQVNPNVENLNLHGNNLTSFEGLGVFSKVKNIKVTQNALKSMNGITAFDQLESLDLSNEYFDKQEGNGILDLSLLTLCGESCMYYDMDRNKVVLQLEKGFDNYYIDLNQFVIPTSLENSSKQFHFKLTDLSVGTYNKEKNIVEFKHEELENINFNEDFIEVTLKDQHNQSYGRTFIYSDMPTDEIEMFKVIYSDGIQDENSFKDQVYQELEKGSATPKYVGNLSRVGYQFKGWSPSISETVTEDAIYVAQWEANPIYKKTYNVTYKDGIQDENSFKDQVYQELEKGSATPKYVGNLSRVGYQFKGWSP